MSSEPTCAWIPGRCCCNKCSPERECYPYRDCYPYEEDLEKGCCITDQTHVIILERDNRRRSQMMSRSETAEMVARYAMVTARRNSTKVTKLSIYEAAEAHGIDGDTYSLRTVISNIKKHEPELLSI